MKTKLLFIVLINMALLGWTQNLTVAVVPFEAKNGYSADEVEGITELFSSYLVETGGLNIVTRTQFNKILTEQNFQMSGLTKDEDYARLGAALNAKAVATGSIMKLGNRTILAISLIDVETAKILSTSRTQFKNLDDLIDNMPTLAKELVKPISSIKAAYKIGDRGPGGGFIFFAENDVYMECSMDLGSGNYAEADRMAKNYRGGGFNDWRLPTISELQLIHNNLAKKKLGLFYISNDTLYRSSTRGDSSNTGGYYYLTYVFGENGFVLYKCHERLSTLVRAVRTF